MFWLGLVVCADSIEQRHTKVMNKANTEDCRIVVTLYCVGQTTRS